MNFCRNILPRLKAMMYNRSATIQLDRVNGQSLQSKSIDAKSQSESEPPIVSANSAPLAQLTEKEVAMAINLTAIASAITKAENVVELAITAVGVVVDAAKSIVSNVKTLIAYVPTLMQSFEDASAAVGGLSGETKLAGVLAGIAAVAAKLKVDWTDTISAIIANIVAQAKAAYNAAASILNASSAAA